MKGIDTVETQVRRTTRDMRMNFVWLLILGENKGGEEAANEKTREAKSPSQIDCICVCPKVVSKV